MCSANTWNWMRPAHQQQAHQHKREQWRRKRPPMVMRQVTRGATRAHKRHDHRRKIHPTSATYNRLCRTAQAPWKVNTTQPYISKQGVDRAAHAPNAAAKTAHTPPQLANAQQKRAIVCNTRGCQEHSHMCHSKRTHQMPCMEELVRTAWTPHLCGTTPRGATTRAQQINATTPSPPRQHQATVIMVVTVLPTNGGAYDRFQSSICQTRQSA